MKKLPFGLILMLGMSIGYWAGWQRRSGTELATQTVGLAVQASADHSLLKTVGRHATIIELVDERTGPDRDAALRMALIGANAEDFMAALQRIEQSRPSLQREIDLRVAYEIWGRTNPMEALAHAQTAGDSVQTGQMLEAVLAGWVTQDAEAAWAWSTAPGCDPRFAQSILGSLARLKPELALELARRLPNTDSLRYQEACWSVVQAVTKDGSYEKALTLIDGLQLDDVRSALKERLAETWAKYDPVSAVSWALEAVDEQGDPSLVWNAARGWGDRNPREAAQFAASFTAGPQRKEMLTSVVTEWSKKDIDAASTWLSKIPASAENDPAIAALATDPIFSTRYPYAAMKWAECIAASETRSGAIQTIALKWAMVDLVAAQTYLEKTPSLSSNQRLLALGALPLRQLREGR
jgi:hypothetical protein